jgi:MoaA/NifB/PqqE/SkfB family radical SAM enzyme
MCPLNVQKDKISVRKLEDIGFYTMTNERAKNSSEKTPLWRCELILTDKCNFKCPYCVPLSEDIRQTLKFEEAMDIVKMWCSENLQNIRFSGGEPTLFPKLVDLVKYCKENGVKRIAVSTNGSNKLEVYKKLIEAGVNDFSISLDADNAELGDKMAGGVKGSWEKVINNIKEISKLSYVTVGMVFTEENVGRVIESVKFASSLGVADIRVISSSQYNKALESLNTLPQELLDKHPILKYRVLNASINQPMRGIGSSDSHKCKLVLDDMAIAGNNHYPCIIYMRQNGKPIGKVSPNMRQERLEWYKTHDSSKDPICRKVCLDACVAFNNVASICQKKNKLME